jgi:hypothetical protein
MTEVNEESVAECAVCSTDIDPDNTYTTEAQEVICSDCLRCCDRCEEIGTANDSYNYVDSSVWCEGCTDRHARYCESCEEYTSQGTNYIADRDVYWCDSCSSNTYFCNDCDNYYDDGYCENCQDTSVIHDYNYRPDPIFHSTDNRERLFFGLEVEVEAGRNLQEASEYANRLEGMDLAYLKSDGSLNCGFEVVTHPMSHDFIKNEMPEFFDTLDALREQSSVRSWGTGTCGVHVHISRTGFNGGAHMHRFLNLVYSNQDFYETIAGRSSDRWAKFSDIMTTKWGARDENGYRSSKIVRSFHEKITDGRSSDRYSAVNTQNQHTLEMRIFRGSTRTHVIKSYVDLAHASVEYSRNLSLKEVISGALEVEPFLDYIVSNEKLYPELVERINRLYIDTNLVRLNGQNVSA